MTLDDAHEAGLPVSVNVVAPDRGTQYGVGEAATQVIAALDAAAIPLLEVPVEITGAGADRHFSVGDHENPFPINLLMINGFDAWQFGRDVPPEFFTGKYTIVLWFWEVGPVPDWMHPSLGVIDEVWVASRHVAQMLAPISPVPVVRIPLPVASPEPGEIDRAGPQLPEGFLFLTMLDLNSSIERKNPLDVIAAYKSAFASTDGASLYVKTGNAEQRPDAFQALLTAAAGRDDITVEDRDLSRGERDALVASCDCYVSLHRAEGFGLTMPEAMLAGKPVIATRHSANLDYMTDENSWLVDCELVPVGPGVGNYPPDGLWAQPDVQQAAGHMRSVFGDPSGRSARTDAAKADIERLHSATASGAAMAERLGVITDHRDGGPAQRRFATTLARRLEAAKIVAYEGVRDEPEPDRSLKPQAIARRLVLKLGSPLTRRSRQRDEQLAEALLQTSDALHREIVLRAAYAEARAAAAQRSAARR